MRSMSTSVSVPVSNTCWYTRMVSIGFVCPSRYIVRRGLTPTSASSEANVRRSVCGVRRSIVLSPR